MSLLETYLILLAVIAIVGVIFRNLAIPNALLLVIVGMIFSFIPDFPRVSLRPDLVLDIFLPLLIYITSAESSWKDVKLNVAPITLLSIGHVLFIAGLAAIAIHTLIPQLGWPMSFVLGAVISPPDDVAIVPIAEKIHMPKRIVTILKGEGMFNDATALILFRFALAAVITHQFSAIKAVSDFFVIIIGETLYGLLLGYTIGALRLRIHDPIMQMIVSILTPFLAYIPAERLGGCGVLATVVTGFVIGHKFMDRYTPEVRLIGRSVWSTLGFTLQSLLFLLVGLDLRFIVDRISTIPANSLFLYTIAILLIVILGRFIYVYAVTYIPRWLFPSVHKEPTARWQYSFIISWAGMRGGISLAAALAVPALPLSINGANPRDLIIFLTFCVIAATLLLQGLTLPWVLEAVGIHTHGRKEKEEERLAEISARLSMVKAVLRWLNEYKTQIKNDYNYLEEIKFHIREYRMLKKQLEERLLFHDKTTIHDENIELRDAIFLSAQILQVERQELSLLWHQDKISHAVRNKLIQQLDLRSRNLLMEK